MRALSAWRLDVGQTICVVILTLKNTLLVCFRSTFMLNEYNSCEPLTLTYRQLWMCWTAQFIVANAGITFMISNWKKSFSLKKFVLMRMSCFCKVPPAPTYPPHDPSRTWPATTALRIVAPHKGWERITAIKFQYSPSLWYHHKDACIIQKYFNRSQRIEKFGIHVLYERYPPNIHSQSSPSFIFPKRSAQPINLPEWLQQMPCMPNRSTFLPGIASVIFWSHFLVLQRRHQPFRSLRTFVDCLDITKSIGWICAARCAWILHWNIKWIAFGFWK